MAAVKIDAELKDEEAELVDAPAPAAAREQMEPSAASRDRVASWAAARRSIVLLVAEKDGSGDDDDDGDDALECVWNSSRGKARYAGDRDRAESCDALANKTCVARAIAPILRREQRASVRVRTKRKVNRMQKEKKNEARRRFPHSLSLVLSLSLVEPLAGAPSGPLLAPRFPWHSRRTDKQEEFGIKKGGSTRELMQVFHFTSLVFFSVFKFKQRASLPRLLPLLLLRRRRRSSEARESLRPSPRTQPSREAAMETSPARRPASGERRKTRRRHRRRRAAAPAAATTTTTTKASAASSGRGPRSPRAPGRGPTRATRRAPLLPLPRRGGPAGSGRRRETSGRRARRAASSPGWSAAPRGPSPSPARTGRPRSRRGRGLGRRPGRPRRKRRRKELPRSPSPSPPPSLRPSQRARTTRNEKTTSCCCCCCCCCSTPTPSRQTRSSRRR